MTKTYTLLLSGILLSTAIFAQNAEGTEKKAPNNWHQLDVTETGFNGISLGKAYDFIKLKNLRETIENFSYFTNISMFLVSSNLLN